MTPSLFWIVAGVVVVGLLVYYFFGQKKGKKESSVITEPTKPEESPVPESPEETGQEEGPGI